jgi:cbb3-type cytochrome oxidase subunit 1
MEMINGHYWIVSMNTALYLSLQWIHGNDAVFRTEEEEKESS